MSQVEAADPVMPDPPHDVTRFRRAAGPDAGTAPDPLARALHDFAKTPSIDTPYKLATRAVRPAGSRISLGNCEFGGDEFIVIAGPCSVESEEQIAQVASAVLSAGARLVRGGAFKPRTSPYSFQGLGPDALRMLREACGRAPIVTEVLAIEDIAAVSAAAAVLQVGARNMHNYPLLRALGRTRRPVLLKRGFAATIEELLLAAEYLILHGNPNVILCERGIRTFETATRNTLDLSAVALLKRLTHLPVIVDPSHGSGRADLVPALAKAAIAVGADGLIIEVHPDPASARSDGDQSLTCAAFRALMRDLAACAPVFGRSLHGGVSSVTSEMADIACCREHIDSIDRAIVALLRERADLALQVGRSKIGNGGPVGVPARERAVLDHVASLASGPLGARAVHRVFSTIIEETRAAEERALGLRGGD